MARLIDARIATAVAKRMAGDRALLGSYLMERLRRDLDVAVPRSEVLVAEASGIPAPPPVRWDIIDRAAWARANIEGMSVMLGPLAEKLSARLDAMPLPVRVAQQAVVSTEMGIVLGYVSRRVLGQYDVLIPEEELPPRRHSTIAPGTMLYFVGPNMVETERRFGFIPEEFALWVALHEVTHRFQFAGVPWLKERFFGLVRSYMESVDLDARGLSKRLTEAASRLASRSVPTEERHPMYLFASSEQRELLDQIQALMAVVEGHGNFVMDSIGAEVIPSFARMRRVFEGRREQVNALQRIINHVLGLEMKLRQYELGQQFCERIVALEGPSALAQLWSNEAQLPTLAELREPERWVKRVA
jgi:coenzyme F420 biosynthesis associated uncharacterized protein